MVPPVEFTITGVVTDEMTLQFVMDANVALIGSDGTSVTTRTTEEGVYNFGKSQVLQNTTYEIEVSKPDYFNNRATITTVGHEAGKDFTQDFLLTPIPEEPIVLPEIQDIHDIRMAQVRHRRRLGDKKTAKPFLSHEIRQKMLI